MHFIWIHTPTHTLLHLEKVKLHWKQHISSQNVTPLELRWYGVFNLKVLLSSQCYRVRDKYALLLQSRKDSCFGSVQLWALMWPTGKQTMQDTMVCHVGVKGWRWSAGKSNGALLLCHTNGLLLRHWELCSPLTMATDDRFFFFFHSSQCLYLPLFHFLRWTCVYNISCH